MTKKKDKMLKKVREALDLPEKDEHVNEWQKMLITNLAAPVLDDAKAFTPLPIPRVIAGEGLTHTGGEIRISQISGSHINFSDEDYDRIAEEVIKRLDARKGDKDASGH